MRRIWVKGRLSKPIEFFPRFGGVQARKAYLRAVISEIRAVDNKSALSALKPHFRPSSLAKMAAMQMLVVLFVNGAPDWIRTNDLCLRRATLYPAELRVLVIMRMSHVRALTSSNLFTAKGQHARKRQMSIIRGGHFKRPRLPPPRSGHSQKNCHKLVFCCYFNGQSLA